MSNHTPTQLEKNIAAQSARLRAVTARRDPAVVDELVAALHSMIVAHRKLAGAAETEVVDRAIAALAKVQA